MAEIDSLGNSFYFSGLQNATNEALKNRKSEKLNQANKTKSKKFSDLLKNDEVQPEFQANGLPPEILELSFDDAVVYLKDQVDNAGNDLSENLSPENLQKFKKSVSQFIKFIVANNFEVSTKRPRRPQFTSPVNYFSNYNTKARLKDPKVQVNIINEKLDALTREMLNTQMNNLKLLQQVDEIKGLIVDLLSD